MDPKLVGIAGGAFLALLLWFRVRSSSSDVAAAPTCETDIEAAHHGGTRDMNEVDLIVLHSTEDHTAKPAAEWFATTIPGVPESKQPGSAHVVVDDTSCFRTLPDDVVPYGAPNINIRGLHIEMAGFHDWTREEWLSHLPTIEKAAGQAAAWSAQYGIPLRFLDAAALRAGERGGVTTHLEATKAFTPGGHVDPGVNFPLDTFFQYAGGSITPEELAAA
jgi:hypothetical protein